MDNSAQYVGQPFFFTGTIVAHQDDICAVQTDDGRVVYVLFKYYDSNGSVVELDQPNDLAFKLPLSTGFFCTYWYRPDDKLVFICGVTQEIKDCTINYPMN